MASLREQYALSVFAGRTGTRAIRGRVHIRWHDGIIRWRRGNNSRPLRLERLPGRSTTRQNQNQNVCMYMYMCVSI